MRRDLDREQQLLNQEDPFLLFCYARDVIKGRWIEAESIIAERPELLLPYTENFVKTRWPEMEPQLKKDPCIWEMYVEDFLAPLGLELDIWQVETW